MSKIRLKHGEHEIELDGTDELIKTQLNDFYVRLKDFSGRMPAFKIKQEILEPAQKNSNAKEPSPAEFYRQKGKDDGISQILILGKYLEEYRGMSEFSREDINKLGKEVKLSKDIHPQYFSNAIKQGLLRLHGKGKYSLTLSAETTLSSM